MAHRTLFAGLAAPDPGETTQVLNSDFIYRNPDLIDQFLRIGAISHRHNAHAALTNPIEPLGAVAIPSGGALPADTYYLTYTLLDANGGETLPAQTSQVTVGDAVRPPSFAPSATVDYTAGIMPAGTYAYAQTYTDGQGGETTLGPVTWVTIDPGFASAQVDFALLAQELSPSGTAIDWRLWRSYEGADWHLVTQAGTDTFTDAGFDPPDNPARPPARNTTSGAYAIAITLPVASAEPALSSAAAFNVYLSDDPGLASPSWFATVPIACAGATLLATDDVTSNGTPPAVSTSLPGAGKIDPDTDMVAWPWLRPVATRSALGSGAYGNVRITLDTGMLWEVRNPSGAIASGDWQPVVAASSGGAGLSSIFASAGNASARVTALEFAASGDASVELVPLGGGSALVLISASGLQGPVGPQGSGGIQGTQGPPGAGVGAGGSGAVPLVDPLSYLEFAASGGVDVAVQVLGGGSARVLIGLPNTMPATTQPSGYAFQPSDVGAVVRSPSASAAVGYLINPNSQTPLPLGAVIEVYRYGPGAVGIAGSGGVIIRSPGGKTLIGDQFGTGGLRQDAIDEWVLSGDLA